MTGFLVVAFFAVSRIFVWGVEHKNEEQGKLVERNDIPEKSLEAGE